MTNFAKIFAPLLAITAFAALFSNLAGAQNLPEFMLTWKAGDYAPADYRGKVLPSDGSRIDVAFELIDGGRFASLGATTINWRVNGDPYKTGLGVKIISFAADATKGDQVVTVSFTYRGVALEKTVTIPVVKPEVVVTGGVPIFRALPYFFNFTSLDQAKFSWTVNGAETEASDKNPDVAALGNLASGVTVNLEATVQNLLKPLEIAKGSLNFTTP